MYSDVSKEYKEIMVRPIRNKGYMMVTVGIINQDAQNGAYLKGSFAEWSNLQFPFNNKSLSGRYATMEQNFFKTDGSMFFLPENNGYAQYINNRETATSALLGSITVKFDANYDIKGITIDFGEYYPTEFTIATDSATYSYSNDGQLFTTDDNFGTTSQFIITPVSMIGGQQRLRIDKITMGLGISFTNSDIMSSSFSEYVSSVAEELSSIDYSLTVADDDNRFNVDDDNSFINFLETGQNVSVSVGLELDSGEVEDLPLGTLLLSDWKASSGQMNFVANDIFSFMDGKYSAGNTIHSRTLYDDAVAVLTDYGLEPDEYELDECLKDVTIVNPLPEASHAECLQLIANAGRCIVFQNRNGQICMKANFATVLNPDDLLVTTKSASAWSHPTNILTGTEYVYADMTKNFFSADGSMYFMPENENYLQTSFASSEVADENGLFQSNPNFSITLPAGYIYYSIYIVFDGNPPEEMVVTTYYNEQFQESILFNELENTNILNHEFKIFDRMVFEFAKASPNNRILVNKISFGDLADYILRKQDMLEKPIGYQEKKTKSVSVRIFTYANNEDGIPEEKKDSVWYKQEINPSGTAVTFENQLISTQTHAQQVAEWIGNYYANNVSYEVSYRGEPRLNAADIIYMESDVLSNLQVEIETHNFTFDGTFNGKLELRRALKMMAGV